jgi:hypothetical protein
MRDLAGAVKARCGTIATNVVAVGMGTLEATGHGVRAKRSKSGAVSFDVLQAEASHAAGQ